MKKYLLYLPQSDDRIYIESEHTPQALLKIAKEHGGVSCKYDTQDAFIGYHVLSSAIIREAVAGTGPTLI